MFLEKVFFEELTSPRLFLKPFYWLHENIEKKPCPRVQLIKRSAIVAEDRKNRVRLGLGA